MHPTTLSTLDRLDSGPFTKLARTMSRNKDVVVELSGMACDTDGNTIRIPANADHIKGAEARVLHGMLDHEVAHVRQEMDVLAARGKGGTGKTPLEIMKEGKTAAERLMLNVYEDVRIERLASEEYPGVAENLRELAAHTLGLYLKEPPTGKDLWQTIGCGIIMRAQRQDVSWMPAELVPILGRLDDEIEEARTTRTVEEAHALALRTIDKLKEFQKQAEEEEARRRAKKCKEGGEGEGAKGNGKGQPGKDPSVVRAGEGDDNGEESKEGMGKLTDDELKAIKDALAGVSTDALADDLNKRTKARIEKTSVDDALTNERYITSPWAKERDAVIRPEGNLAEYLVCKERVASQIGALKGKLCSVIRVRAQSRLQGDQDRGVLDVATLHTLRTGNRKIFAQRTKEENLDTAMSLVVDVSGSMGPGTLPGSRSYYAKHMAIALAETFSALSVPFEAMGFTNVGFRFDGGFPMGAGNVVYGRFLPFEFHLYKSFLEPLQRVREKFAAISGYSENSDGEAIMFAARRLAVRKEQRKIMFVVSDGLPTGGPEPLVCKYLREAIQKITSAGIEVYGIGAGHAGVADFYNASNGASHIVINNIEKMAVDVYKLVKDRLTTKKKAA